MPGEHESEPEPEGVVDERSTERRIAAAFAEQELDAPLDVHDAEFTAHVLRGTSLLRTGHLDEAKDAFEQAMALDPCQPKLHDLLGSVYFRLGRYERSVEMFELLLEQFPRDPAVKLNVALAYLKEDRVDDARSELEELVRVSPHHRRAWGYLGVTYERLGSRELALRAFERGKLPDMASRIARGPERMTVPAPSAEASALSDGSPPIVSIHGFAELDGGVLTPHLAEGIPSSAGGAALHAPPLPPSRRPSLPREMVRSARHETGVAGKHAGHLASDAADGTVDVIIDEHTTAPPPPLERKTEPPPAPQAAFTRTLGANTASGAMPPRPARSAEDRSARRLALEFPQARGIARDPSGVMVVRVAGNVGEGGGFAARLAAVRAYTATLGAAVLERQVKSRSTSEPFGGFTAPLVRLDGAGDLVLAARAGHTLVALDLEGERAVFRENLIAGFELRLTYENVRAPLDEGDATAMVELRGTGGIVLEPSAEIRAMPIAQGRGACARRETIAGWLGPLTPRAVTPREAPAGQPGMVIVEGEGLLFLLTR